jgi:hypothetical protein
MKHISTLWLMEMIKNRKKHERENMTSLDHNYCLIQNVWVAVGVGIIEVIYVKIKFLRKGVGPQERNCCCGSVCAVLQTCAKIS